jgi:hypothetical protein
VERRRAVTTTTTCTCEQGWASEVNPACPVHGVKKTTAKLRTIHRPVPSPAESDVIVAELRVRPSEFWAKSAEDREAVLSAGLADLRSRVLRDLDGWQRAAKARQEAR